MHRKRHLDYGTDRFRGQEVAVCKDECREAMEYARQINALIMKFRDQYELFNDQCTLSTKLQLEFAALERCVSLLSSRLVGSNFYDSVVLECVSILGQCMIYPMNLTSRLRLYAKRAELTKDIRGCTVKLGHALQQIDVCRHIIKFHEHNLKVTQR